MSENIEEIKVIPPKPGSCKICATMHNPGEPHDRDSLYYQNQFYKKHKRFPTWNDAMEHCDEAVREEYIKKLAKRRIIVIRKEK